MGLGGQILEKNKFGPRLIWFIYSVESYCTKSGLKFALFCNNLKTIKMYHISASSIDIGYTIACFSQIFFLEFAKNFVRLYVIW